MNLRQKVKQAKRELAVLEQQQTRCTWDMYVNFNKRADLQKVINRKRKLDTMYKKEELHELDFEKLTYVAIYAGFEKLAELKSLNGKPFTRKEVDEYLESVMKNRLLDRALNVSRQEWKTHKGIDTEWEKREYNTVRYTLRLSSDRKKNKRYHYKIIFYQVKGSDKLYKPQKEGE